MKHTYTLQRRARCLTGALIAAGITLFPLHSALAQSTWNPTLLVNTESFQIIDEGDNTTNIELQFGTTLPEKIYWEKGAARFRFTDDVHVEESITASGSLTTDGQIRTKDNLTINADNGATDAVLTFGGTAPKTITYSNANTRFQFDDDVSVVGVLSGSSLTVDGNAAVWGAFNAKSTSTFDGAVQVNSTIDATGKIETSDALSGASLTVDNLKGCEIVYTDANGVLQCSTDNYMTEAEGDTRYINVTGDTMQGQLTIANGAGLTASGDILTAGNIALNKDNAAKTAKITFGTQTLTYSGATSRFQFNDDLSVTGVLSGSSLRVDGNADVWGALTVSGATTVKGHLSGSTLEVDGAVTLRGQTYNFPTNAQQNGYVLTTDGAGNLTWGVSGAGMSSGSIMSFHPAYPNAIYNADGTNNVGQLTQVLDGVENVYKWTTSRTTVQDYDVVVRVRVPNTFSSWDPANGISLRYKTQSGATAVNFVNLEVFDTAGASDYTTGDLASDVFTNAAVTAADLNGTYTPGDYMTVKVKLGTRSTRYAEISYLNFNWETTVP